jgi:hypothetical protein
MVRELWNDPVWSKVIAALITAAVLTVGAEIIRRVSPDTLTRLVSRWQGEIRGVVIATAIYAVIWVAVAVLRSNPARVLETTTSTPQIEATPTDSRDLSVKDDRAFIIALAQSKTSPGQHFHIFCVDHESCAIAKAWPDFIMGDGRIYRQLTL